MVSTPRLCSNCNRPSPDQYVSCMYCGGPLAAAQTDQSSGAEALGSAEPLAEEPEVLGQELQPSVRSDVDLRRADLLSALSRSRGPFGPRSAAYRLILIPAPANREGAHWLMHRLAAQVGIDLYTARSHLNRQVPSFLAESEHRGHLEEMAAPLREAGLLVTIISRTSWLDDALPVPVVAASCDGADTDCTFVVADGGKLLVNRASLLWAALARIEPRRPLSVSDAQEDGVVSSSPSPLSRDSGSYQLLDILLSDRQYALRLRADRFDFSCLGEARSISAEVNLRALLSWLSHDPQQMIPVDELFRRVPAVALDKSRDRVDGSSASGLSAREIEFTEYVLILHQFNRELDNAD